MRKKKSAESPDLPKANHKTPRNAKDSPRKGSGQKKDSELPAEQPPPAPRKAEESFIDYWMNPEGKKPAQSAPKPDQKRGIELSIVQEPPVRQPQATSPAAETEVKVQEDAQAKRQSAERISQGPPQQHVDKPTPEAELEDLKKPVVKRLSAERLQNKSPARRLSAERVSRDTPQQQVDRATPEAEPEVKKKSPARRLSAEKIGRGPPQQQVDKTTPETEFEVQKKGPAKRLSAERLTQGDLQPHAHKPAPAADREIRKNAPAKRLSGERMDGGATPPPAKPSSIKLAPTQGSSKSGKLAAMSREIRAVGHLRKILKCQS